MGISVVINTKNSAETLLRAISSVAFAAEIIVVDMHSSDDTVAVAHKAGAKVYPHRDVGYVEPARQFAIERASQDWILVLDADEVIPPLLADKLQAISGNSAATLQPVAYALARKNLVFGSWVKGAGWWPDYQIRFFKKNTVSWPETIHAVPVVHGECEELAASEAMAITHWNYDTVSSFIQRMDRYTSIQAVSDAQLNTPLSTRMVLSVYTSELLRRLFAGNGWRGGAVTVAVALLQTTSELIRELKRWELGEKQTRQPSTLDLTAFDKLRAELAYWVADTHHTNSRGIARLWWRLRRKLRV